MPSENDAMEQQQNNTAGEGEGIPEAPPSQPSPEMVRAAEEKARQTVAAEQQSADDERQAVQTYVKSKTAEYVAAGMSDEHAKKAVMEGLSIAARGRQHVNHTVGFTGAVLTGIKDGKITAEQAESMFQRGASIAEVEALVSTAPSQRERELQTKIAELERDKVAGATTAGVPNSAVSSGAPTEFTDDFFANVLDNPFGITEAQAEAFRRAHPELNLDPAAAK